jgi:hypothetical protein
VASSSDYHQRAPKCSAFVKEMRAVFGDVEVLYVKENDVLLGEPDSSVSASTNFPQPEKKSGRDKNP